MSSNAFFSHQVEAGQHAVFASDMYSFGVLLLYMHYPAVAAALVPGSVHIPPGSDPDLSDLIQKLLVLTASLRPAAAAALMHPYFRSTFVERLMQEGEVVEQVRWMDAILDICAPANAFFLTFSVQRCFVEAIRRATLKSTILRTNSQSRIA